MSFDCRTEIVQDSGELYIVGDHFQQSLFSIVEHRGPFQTFNIDSRATPSDEFAGAIANRFDLEKEPAKRPSRAAESSFELTGRPNLR